MNRHVNWELAKQDFVTSGVTLGELALMHKSSGRSMRRHCRDGEWRIHRMAYRMEMMSFEGPVVGFDGNPEGKSSPSDIQVDTRDDAITVTVRSDKINTVSGALSASCVDMRSWEVDRSSIRSAGMRNRWQVQVWLRRKVVDYEEAAESIERAFASLPPFNGFGDVVPDRNCARGLVEISMPDIHLGKLSWDDETGHGNGDLRLILEAVDETLKSLAVKALLQCPERIVFVIGNDLLHIDNLEGSTTKGTPQDVDGRAQKLFEAAIAVNRMAIGLLSRIAPVDVIMIAGNHDTFSLPHLGSALQGYFHDDDRVTIDNSVRSRKYYQFGKVLLGFCHGGKDDPKLSDLPLLMMRENQSIINEVEWMEWHIGHKHGRKSLSWLSVESDKGIHVRILPALCVPDKWHASKGFVGQPQAADMYLWDKVNGYRGHLTHNYVRKGE